MPQGGLFPDKIADPYANYKNPDKTTNDGR